MATPTHVKNLIIGAGLVGSVTAWALSRHGESGILIERNADPGGVNGSFADPDGNYFDYGRHVINADRSETASELFRETMGPERIRQFDLRRSIVIKGHRIPWAAPLEEWPQDLKQHIDLDLQAPPVHLGCTRHEFARAYGQAFADLVFDEMINAYPTLRWRRDHGTREELLLDWIFPWFFPLSDLEQHPDDAEETGVNSHESRLYHYQRRRARPPVEPVLYPSGGRGFGEWVETMLAAAAESFDIRTGVTDVTPRIDPDTLQVTEVVAGGHRYTADRVFWCAPLPVLCKTLDWPLPKGQPQWELLGNFTFDQPVDMEDHEILFADPQFRIRRINAPGLIAGESATRTLQVEYTTWGEETTREPGEWRAEWLDNLRQLGLVSGDAEPRHFELKRVSRGIVSAEDLGAFLQQCEQRLASADNNLITPHLAVSSDNNARLVPKVYRHVTQALGNR